eukprot:6212075-Amphidinium_carterae.2
MRQLDASTTGAWQCHHPKRIKQRFTIERLTRHRKLLYPLSIALPCVVRNIIPAWERVLTCTA